MTIEELKTAFAIEKPVVFNGMTFKYVSAIIWRKNKEGKRIFQAELQDEKANCVVIADPDRVEYFNRDEIKNTTIYVGNKDN